MQKLLRRNPHGPILCTTGNALPLRLGFKLNNEKKFLHLPSKTPNHSLSQGFKKSTKKIVPFGFIMLSAATFSSSGSISPVVAPVSKNHTAVANDTSAFSSQFAVARNCRICRLSVDTNGSPFQAWDGFKRGHLGFRSMCSSAGFDEVLAADGVKSSEKGLGNCSVGDNVEGEKVLNEEKPTEKPLRLQRRQKSSSAIMPETPDSLKNNPDSLKIIPGVGPRNEEKLVEKGIQGVSELKQLYKDKFFGKSSQKMVEFLQCSVGIIHKHHAEKITTFIKKSVDEELKEDASNVKPAPKRLTFCVEGNISVGKSTFLQRIANETLELRNLVEVVPEPVNKWQDVGPDHFNILDAFYAEPERYAYTFQNYVFVTRLMQEKESSGGIKPLRLMERSVFSDRMVFVRSVHEAKWMSEMEISIYDSWFDPVVSSLPGLIPDGFIYLRASPDTCHKRMLLRKRAEESRVSLDYLRDLHDKHESWLFPYESGNHGVLSVSNPSLLMDNSLHPDIRDRVFYLEGDHMHSSIRKVPALVLDCEPNIDFSKDVEAKEQYARQVAKFFEFVKKKKEVPPVKSGEDAAKSGQPQVLLPHKGGLWVPGGQNFSESALRSLDFRRAMSMMSG